MQKVLIVLEGQWGSVKPESYKDTVEAFKLALDKAKVSLGGEEEKAAETTIVETVKEAEELVRRGGIHVLMFISRGMERKAEELAARYPKTRIIVATGLIPEGKVVWLNKWWLSSGDNIREIILNAQP